MKESRFIDVKPSTKDMAASIQDIDLYAKVALEQVPSEYERLLGYCVLVKRKNTLGLRPLYFSLDGSSYDFKPKLEEYLNNEIAKEPKIPTYISTNLGNRAIAGAVLENNIFGAIEFGRGSSQVSKKNNNLGAQVVIPRNLLNEVPRIAYSELQLYRLRSETGNLVDYYKTVIDPNSMIESTKNLVVSGLLKALHSVK